MASILGSANGTDTLTLTLTADVPADGVLQLVYAQVGISTVDHSSQPSSVVDSNSITWTRTSATAPIIGEIRGSASDSLQTGSAARACTAGDLHTGDTVTIVWGTFPGESFFTAALLVYMPALFTAVTQTSFGGIYTNSISYPDFAGAHGATATTTRLGWTDTNGFSGSQVDGDASALMVTAMAAYPALAGFNPALGTLLGEKADGTCSIACGVNAIVAHSLSDPGGTWSSARSLLAGNYQLLTALSPAAVHISFHG